MTSAPLIGISRHRIKVDGHGVTTLVAFHGCPLRCKYCLNSQCLSKDGVWKELTAQQVYDYVKKDEIYFLATNGGICFGGGEPCLRVDSIKEFRKLCGDKWKITIESSLNVPTDNIRNLLSVVDAWIVDIKDMNPEIYKAYTGIGNERAIENLKLLAGTEKNVLVRVPMIPGFNTEEDVQKSVLELKRMGVSKFDLFEYRTNK